MTDPIHGSPSYLLALDHAGVESFTAAAHLERQAEKERTRTLRRLRAARILSKAAFLNGGA